MHQLPIIDCLPADDPTSPYYGLTVKEQLMLSKIRRGKKSTPMVLRRKWKKHVPYLYSSILKHAVETLLYAQASDTARLDRVFIYMRLPFNFRRYCRGVIPRPYPIGYDDFHIYVRFSCDKIIDYLHSIGESAYTAKELRKEIWAINREMDKLLWLDEVSVDLCWQEGLEAIIPAAQAEREANPKVGKRFKRNRKKILEKKEELAQKVLCPADKVLDNPENV